MEEFKIDNSPTDCISCIKYSKSSNVLSVSSWDCTVSLYDTDKNKLVGRYNNKSAVLSCDIIDADTACLGGLDCEVKIFDFHKKQERLLGKHKAAVSCVIYVESRGWIISCSWDMTVKIWDTTSNATQNPVATLTQQYKVYSMDLANNTLILSLDKRQIVVYNLDDLVSPPLIRECLLKFNTRSIRCLLDASGFIVGSVEGRVGVEFLSGSNEMKPFSFRCHRKPDVNGTEMIYPVNALAIHPIYGTFATGGADGSVSIWDGMARKRLAYFPNYNPGVSCLAFSRDGTKLAVACSYTFEQGPSITPTSPVICIRSLNPVDYTPQNMTA